MPYPAEYQRCTDHFQKFLIDARNAADLGSSHQSYTMSQGVLQTFRRRLSLQDAIRFAALLPAALRALFVSDWDPSETIQPFTDRESMTREVRSLRAKHNFSPDDAIYFVAIALRKNMDTEKLDEFLHTLPEDAQNFWSTEPSLPHGQNREITAKL